MSSGALQVNATNFESMLMNKRVSLSQVVLRLATQWEPGLMIPYAEYQGIVHSDSISTYYGTDHGICAKIHPQVRVWRSLISVQRGGLMQTYDDTWGRIHSLKFFNEYPRNCIFRTCTRTSLIKRN